MKRIGLKLALSALIVMMSTAFCFAGTFSVLETTPVDGQKETSIDNLCVKMYFDDSVSFEKTIKSQKDCFKVVGEDGKYVPLKVLYDKKEHVILALAYDEKTNNSSSKIVAENSDYKFTVSSSLVDDKGNTFEVAKENMDENGDFTITFKTQNQKRATRVNFLLMVLMFGGIMVFSTRSMKKQKREEEERKQQKKTKINPYEEAKRTGKSVEEIIAREEKIKAKEEAKRKKYEEELARQEEEELEALRATYFKVSKPRPISEAGSKFISGKKPKAPANNNNSKKKKKKK